MLEEDDAGRHAPYRLWTVKEYYKACCASQQNLAADVAVGSIASLRACVGHFRFTPDSGHIVAPH